MANCGVCAIHKINYIWIFVLFGHLVSASSLYNYDDSCKILKQDHLQQFIDYDCKQINSTSYEIYWQVINEQVFDDLDNYSTETMAERIKNIGKKYKETEKGRKLADVALEYNLKYDADKIKNDIEELKGSYFPMKKNRGTFSIDGRINPYDSKYGRLLINKKDKGPGELEVGYGTLIVEFSNGKSNETLDICFSPGFNDPEIRYLQAQRYSSLSYGLINVTGILGDYGIYDEYEYFDGSFSCAEQDYTSYIENPPAGGTSTCTQSGSSLYMYTYMGSAAGTYERYQIMIMDTLDNLKDNHSILMDLYMQSTSFAGGNSNGAIRITDGTQVATLESISTSVGMCSGSDDDAFGLTRKYNINTSTMNITVYDENNTYVKTVDVSTLTGNTWNIYVYEYATAGCNGGGGTQIYIYDIGINDNETEYKNYAEATVYPNGTTLYIGDTLAYINYTELTTKQEINVTSEIMTTLNNGACDCTECILEDTICNIPFIFSSNTGASLYFEDLEINYSLQSLNITFYYEEDSSIVDDINVSAVFSSESRSINFTTETGLATIPWYDFEDYNVWYWADGYSVRTRIFTHDGSDNPTLALYLANDTDTNDVVFEVYDQYGNRVSNAYISIHKKFIDSNEFLPIIDIKTNVNGEASASLSYGEGQLYRYIITYNSEVVWNETSVNGEPIYSTDEIKPFYVTLNEDIYDFDRIADTINGNVTFTDNNGSFSYLFNYSSLYSIEFCLNLYNFNYNNYSLVTYDCENGTSGNLNITFYAENGTFQGLGVFSYNDRYYYVDSSIDKINASDVIFDTDSKDGLLIALIVIILAAVGFKKYPSQVIISSGSAFVLMVSTNIIYIEEQSLKWGIIISTIAIIGALVAIVRTRSNE